MEQGLINSVSELPVLYIGFLRFKIRTKIWIQNPHPVFFFTLFEILKKLFLLQLLKCKKNGFEELWCQIGAKEIFSFQFTKNLL